MNSWKRTLVLLFFVAAGVIIGSLIASLAGGIPFLSWLGYGKTVGISTDNPMVLDLSVLKIAFGFELGINVAQIGTILAGVLLYRKVGGKL